MGRKNGHQSDCLTIFAFDLDETRDGQTVAFASETAKLARLSALGFNVIAHQRCSNADEAIAYFRRIANGRDALPIWIDGVVMKFDDLAAQAALGVTGGRPKGQVAWKFDSVGEETVLEGVVVSGGHTGAMNPTAQLRPVEIAGTLVSNASLANYDEIARLDVAIGDSVWVVKANDIIPKIIRVTQRPRGRIPILPPAVCPFCQGETGRRPTHDGSMGVIVECRNPDCPKKSSGKIRRWIASLDILGIGDSVLEAMIDRFDLEDAAGLYTLRERQADLADLIINTEKGISLGAKRATSILQAIDATRNLTLSQFLGSLGLDHLGKRRVHLMMQNAAGQLDTLDDWRSGKLRDPAIANAAGVPNIGTQIQDGIDAMTPIIDKLLAAGVSVLAEQGTLEAETKSRPTICISGKLQSGRKKTDYAEPLRTAGYVLVDEVSKGLSYLVLADPGSTSSKAEKARKLGIEVISEERLEEIVGRSDTMQTVVNPQTIAPVQYSETNTEELEMNAAKSNTSSTGAVQRFEYVDDKSSKFWEVAVDGTSVNVRFGKIGTTGQTSTKEMGDAAAAAKQADKLIAEKLKGGYVRVGSDTAAPKSPDVAKPSGPAKARADASKPESPKATSAVGPKTVCISGKLPSGKKKADYAEILAKAGYELLDDVKTGLTYLVLADPDAAGAKADKAKKLGISIISEEELIELCNRKNQDRKVQANGKNMNDSESLESVSLEELTEELEIHKKLLALIKKMRRKYKNEDWFVGYGGFDAKLKDIEAGKPAWFFDLVEIPVAKVDRRGSMLAGPFFTSSEYPWPEANGKHDVPIVQVDLRDFSRLSGKNLGDGLLQVWMVGDSLNGDVRVIPRNVVDNAALLNDVPTTATMDSNWGCFAECLNGGIDEVYVIKGFQDPVFSMYCNIEDLDWGLEDVPEIAEFKELASKIEGNETGHHAFGSFSRVQYSPGECADVLIALDSDLPFSWGDSGNAQIFYKVGKNGDPEFWFNWSCY